MGQKCIKLPKKEKKNKYKTLNARNIGNCFKFARNSETFQFKNTLKDKNTLTNKKNSPFVSLTLNEQF